MNKGQVFDTQNGPMEILEYLNCNRIKIRFLNTGHERFSTAGHIKNRQVRDPFYPSVAGVGFVGNTKVVDKGSVKKSYRVWKSMIERCYDPLFLNRQRCYRDCYVVERWKNFELFEQDVKELEGYSEWLASKSRYDLDKDIKFPGNRIYSKEFCKFVPQSENVRAAHIKVRRS